MILAFFPLQLLHEDMNNINALFISGGWCLWLQLSPERRWRWGRACKAFSIPVCPKAQI